jgi:hypothetical protein
MHVMTINTCPGQLGSWKSPQLAVIVARPRRRPEGGCEWEQNKILFKNLSMS